MNQRGGTIGGNLRGSVGLNTSVVRVEEDRRDGVIAVSVRQ